MERFIYVNNIFWDRVDNTPIEILHSFQSRFNDFNKVLDFKSEYFNHSVCGKSQRIDIIYGVE